MKTVEVYLVVIETLLHNTDSSFADFMLEKEELYFRLKMCFAKEGVLTVCLFQQDE